jgi:hypothetical protein
VFSPSPQALLVCSVRILSPPAIHAEEFFSFVYICRFTVPPLQNKDSVRKRTSGVPSLWTSVVTHTYVKTDIAPPYLALRGFTELPELNSSKPLLWLVQFLILIISLAAYFHFCRFFCASGVPCCSSMSSLYLLLGTNLLKFVTLQRRLRKILPSASFGLI